MAAWSVVTGRACGEGTHAPRFDRSGEVVRRGSLAEVRGEVLPVLKVSLVQLDATRHSVASPLRLPFPHWGARCPSACALLIRPT